ncbi:hypothetical protein [Ralstonia phage phiITL-1]|uniref:Uncharacterized protein n=1 Tax=Ralstonia phage phiITL-1 TaxID=1597967 RepID=A0A0U1ZDU0_9CAUD|nr:hypothetical protein HOR02_gp15 [Ralstonia phage phiITL-1]AJT60799.1 hypothetical protein [Ralstonia phage phiITL-1]
MLKPLKVAFKAYREAARMIAAKHIGYIVWSAEYRAVHVAFTLKGAIEWQSCYDDAVIVAGQQVVRFA